MEPLSREKFNQSIKERVICIINNYKLIREGEKVVVILGDNIFEDSFKLEVDLFKKSNKYNCMLFLKKVNDPERFGVAELNMDNRIIKIEEKPSIPKSNFAVTGLYFYNEEIFEVIEKIIKEIGYSSRGELEITDVNNYYIKNKKVKVNFVEGFWSDAGTFDTLLRVSNFIRKSIL